MLDCQKSHRKVRLVKIGTLKGVLKLAKVDINEFSKYL